MNQAFHKLLNRILPPTEEDFPPNSPISASAHARTSTHAHAQASTQTSTSAQSQTPAPRPNFTPQTTKELMDVLRRTPRSILSNRERAIIASAMTFSDRRVKDIMISLPNIPYVKENDFLGPFMLDKLYQSGLSHFPVIGQSGRIVGVIHTESLNRLEVKDTARAKDYLDPHIFFIREDYTLEQALAALLRTNCFFFIVLNQTAQTVGMLTYKDLIIALFGITPTDNFTQDADPFAVAHRA